MTTITKLTRASEAIAKVLNNHGVFTFEEDTDEFVRMIERNLTELEKLEITYRATNVRLFVTPVLDDGEYVIQNVLAIPHPEVNAKIDYDQLNADIASVLA